MVSRNRHAFRNTSSQVDLLRRSGYIPRSALQNPISSAFSTLYRSNGDAALIKVTWSDHTTFHYILSKFSPTYDIMSPYSKDGNIRLKRCKQGRPRIFESNFGLALVLLHLQSRGSNNLLQMVFGATKGPMSVLLRFARGVLLDVIKGEPDAKVAMPK